MADVFIERTLNIVIVMMNDDENEDGYGLFVKRTLFMFIMIMTLVMMMTMVMMTSLSKVPLRSRIRLSPNIEQRSN